MKTYFLATLIIGLSLTSCIENTKPLPNQEPISITDSNTSTTLIKTNHLADTLTTNSTNDTLAAINEIEKKVFSISILDSLAAQLHLALKENPSKEKIYKEDIPFTSFLGKSIEVGELEISRSKNQKHIHADYFDGAPMGAKKFLLQDDNLFCIEIIHLQEEVTENGSIVVEKITHKFYYENDSLMEIIDNISNTSLLDSTIIWKNENLKDWKLIQSYL